MPRYQRGGQYGEQAGCNEVERIDCLLAGEAVQERTDENRRECGRKHIKNAVEREKRRGAGGVQHHQIHREARKCAAKHGDDAAERDNCKITRPERLALRRFCFVSHT